MTQKKNVITADLFKFFKDECIKWLDAFGLADWTVVFTCEGSVEHDGALAGVWFSPDGLNAQINISKDWVDQPVTKIQIQRCALHEVCHILTARMEILASERFITQKEIVEESEKIARRVEHYLWRWRR